MLIDLVDGDAESFLPLSEAYSIPKDDPNRDEVMENVLNVACSVPMEIMRRCCERSSSFMARWLKRAAPLQRATPVWV